jgi:hypothetical protein
MIFGLTVLLLIINSELYPDRIAIEFVIIDIIVIIVLIFTFVLRFSKVNMLPNLSTKKYILEVSKKAFATTNPGRVTFCSNLFKSKYIFKWIPYYPTISVITYKGLFFTS